MKILLPEQNLELKHHYQALLKVEITLLYMTYRQLAITFRIIAIAITIMAKKVIDYCNNY